jgi:hypothetical protein
VLLMNTFWDGVTRREKRSARHEKQKAYRMHGRAQAFERRRPYTKGMRYLHQSSRRMYELNLMSSRRAIMIQPSGMCSPVVLLPSTRNSRGIIGSFLGGDANVVAFRDIGDGTELVVFCVNDDICDDEWSDDANDILKRMDFKMVIMANIKLHGHALVVRLCRATDGVVYIGDVVIKDGIARSIYCRQTEAPEDTSVDDNSHDPESESHGDASEM